MDEETYLGDGVYASFDGYQIWLRVDDGSRIALEPGVYASLVAYRDKIYGRLAVAAASQDGDEE